MDFELITKRGRIIYEIAEEKMNDPFENSTHNLFDALRASYAIKTQSLHQYIKAFSGDLFFDINAVELVYKEFAAYLPGHRGLAPIEKEILNEVLTTIEERNL